MHAACGIGTLGEAKRDSIDDTGNDELNNVSTGVCATLVRRALGQVDTEADGLACWTSGGWKAMMIEPCCSTCQCDIGGHTTCDWRAHFELFFRGVNNLNHDSIVGIEFCIIFLVPWRG